MCGVECDGVSFRGVSAREGRAYNGVQWLAPEIITANASSTYGPKSDVYSFAMVCWEIATRGCAYLGAVVLRPSRVAYVHGVDSISRSLRRVRGRSEVLCQPTGWDTRDQPDRREDGNCGGRIEAEHATRK